MAVVGKSYLPVVSLLSQYLLGFSLELFLEYFFSCRNPACGLFQGVFSHFGILSVASFSFQVAHMQMAAKYSVNSKLAKKYD